MALFAVSTISGIDARFELWNQLKVRGPVLPVPVILNLLLSNHALGAEIKSEKWICRLRWKIKTLWGPELLWPEMCRSYQILMRWKNSFYLFKAVKKYKQDSATQDNPAFRSSSLILCNVSWRIMLNNSNSIGSWNVSWWHDYVCYYKWSTVCHSHDH